MKTEKLQQALSLWVDITGVNPLNHNVYSSFHDYDIQSINDSIKEVIEIDKTDITAYYLLDYFVTNYFDDYKFSVNELIEDSAYISEFLNKGKTLISILKSSDIVSAGDDFAKIVELAIEQYDAKTDAVLKLIKQRHQLGFLRRDALRSINNLRVDQFLSGEPEKQDITPIYSKTIHQFLNVNALLNAAMRMPSGVSLNLIRHSDKYQSYFVFAIRNGGNLYLLSDKPNQSHPLQGGMSRRPDKNFDKRANGNWFPYSLLDDSDSCNTGITKFIESEIRPLININQLNESEIVWLTLIFGLIIDKFWIAGYQSPSLSYTGEMIKIDSPMLSAQESNLAISVYSSPKLKPITLDDVSFITNKKAFGEQYNSNAWIEKRFHDQVRKEIDQGLDIFNIVTAPDVITLLENEKTKKILESTDANYDQNTNNGTVTITDDYVENLNHFDGESIKSRFKLSAMDTTNFDTRENIENDRLFIARNNLAIKLNQLAYDEYEKTKNEIFQWVNDRVRNNFSNLKSLIAQEKIITKVNNELSDHAFMVTYNIKTDSKDCFLHHDLSIYTSLNHGAKSPTCAVNDTASSYVICFYPFDANDLAILCGCDVFELPEVLRHWVKRAPYTGNSILDKIDPMDWVLKNPWLKMNLNVSVYLSTRALNAIKNNLSNKFDKTIII